LQASETGCSAAGVWARGRQHFLDDGHAAERRPCGEAKETTMSGKKRDQRPEARLPKGMRDVEATEIRAMERMLGTIRQVYESYGFEPLDTPAFEYTDALGKFLPDQDRPNEGVFSLQDEDEQWLSLRYDLTAPLARYVAQNFDALAKPFRRYQNGPVWRNEKPGPGRFRQFVQFDADTVGTDNVAADAELCMLAADTLEALGLKGQYVIKFNNRKVIDGLRENIGLAGPEHDARWLTAMRALDKYDRLGMDGVVQLLGSGRQDDSGDFTKGAELSAEQITRIQSYLSTSFHEGRLELNAKKSPILNPPGENQFRSVSMSLDFWRNAVGDNATGLEGVKEIEDIQRICKEAGFDVDRIMPDATVIRGLEYYTGPVIEAELTFNARNEDGQLIRFGSVGGGGRYDGLVSRFKGTKIPATGFSIGVSRLYAALQTLGKLETGAAAGPVVILAMDRERIADYTRMARTLREAGIRAEMYLGTSGMKAQMKYADKRSAPCVVIQGGDELARGEVTIKDLIEGERLSAEIADHQEWREGRPAQFSVKESELVEAVRSVLARHGKAPG
jgi:histidyl-tRNA synthetase